MPWRNTARASAASLVRPRPYSSSSLSFLRLRPERRSRGCGSRGASLAVGSPQAAFCCWAGRCGGPDLGRSPPYPLPNRRLTRARRSRTVNDDKMSPPGRERMKRLLCGASAFALFAGVALADPNPLRNAYFGETHIHTSYSADAWLFGDRMTDPGDAYKYFKGEMIKAPLGYDIKIVTPLDFAGVTDHSEYVGVIRLANDPSSPISKLPAAQPLIIKGSSMEAQNAVFLYALKNLMGGTPDKALLDPEVSHTVWDSTVKFAEEANEPGKFTAFCSYEWTSMPNAMNLHRNIFFKDCKHIPAAPFSALDSTDPSELWRWMDGQRKAGNQLLAISHNANLSDGRMYPTEVDLHGRPIDRAYAEDRMRNEPLIELAQTKGQSETHPLLSPNDEFANYNIWAFLLGDPQGRITHIVGSYARQALKDGIALQDARGFNPYKFGFGAASDSHATGVPYRQDNYFGTIGVQDGSIEARLSGRLLGGMDAR